jgi:hypothetical protein
MSFVVPNDVPFERVWSRMTAAEASRALTIVVDGEASAADVGAPDSYHTAEGALSVWHWNGGAGSYVSTSPYRYAGGIFNSNRTAHEVRERLKRAFESDRTAFLAVITSNDARASALCAADPSVASGTAGVVTPIAMWNPNELNNLLAAFPTANSRGNLCRPVTTQRLSAAQGGGLPNVASVVSQLAALPAGQRILKLADNRAIYRLPISGGSADGRFALLSREFDTAAPAKGLSLLAWKNAVTTPGSDWITFWDQLLAQGGTGIVDLVLFDIEARERFATIKAAPNKTLTHPETWDDFFAQAEWNAGENFRQNVFKPVLSQAVWDTWRDWDTHNDERCFAIDAALRQYWRGMWAPVLAIIRNRFPAVAIYAYDEAVTAAGTRPTASATDYTESPLGSDGAFAPTSTSIAIYGTYWNRTFYWRNRGSTVYNPSGAARAWAALVQGVALVQSQQAASTLPRQVFVTYEGFTPEIGELYRELVLHALLDDVSLAFYNSAGGIPSGGEPISPSRQKQIVDLVAERDLVVGYTRAYAEPGAPIQSYALPYLASRAYAGGRWVWRLTPNPTLAPPTITPGAELTLVFETGETLRIPGGNLFTPPGGSLAPAGYWIIQPAQSPAVESARRLYGHGSIAIGTTPVQVVPAPPRAWCRRLVVRASEDNGAALIYLGASAAVNGINGDPNCGWPLAAGEERRWPLRVFVDGGHTDGLWAVASSGTAYLIWEAQ